MGAGKAGDQWRHMAAAKTQRGIDAQQALGLGAHLRDLLLQRFDIGQDAPRLLYIGFAFHRQVQAPGCAADELHAQARFHLAQALAGGGCADAQFTRRGRQAASAC